MAAGDEIADRAETESALRELTPLQRLIRPVGSITVYYLGLGAGLALILRLFPGFAPIIPVGGAEMLSHGFQDVHFEPVNLSADAITMSYQAPVRLILSLVSALILMLPIAWIYMGSRKRKDIFQSFVNTILLLPIVVTGIVHVVQNSLALAFSLAGIVAGVRFRHTLKDTGDTTYLFTSIGIGLACGVEAVEVAAIVSIAFAYTILVLWATNFGERATGTRSFADTWMAKKDKNGKRRAKREPGADDVEA